MTDLIHLQAVEISKRYLRAEAELVCVLQQVEQHRVFVRRGHASLFSYVTGELGLSESMAYTLITVARKAREVPALAEGLKEGEITLSNAKRVVSVLTAENQSEWLEKARVLSSRQLEKEVVRVKPGADVRELVSYVTPERVRLELGLSEKQMLKLRRVQDVLSQKRKRHIGLEEVLAEMTEEFLERHDPLEKAKRQVVRKSPTSAVEKLSARKPDSATRHRVNLRDEGRCTFVLPDGTRCTQRRWLEMHHKIPFSEGGLTDAENLTMLCSSHHRYRHSK